MLRNHFFYVACYQKIMLHIKCVVLASSIEQLHIFKLSKHFCKNEVYIFDQFLIFWFQTPAYLVIDCKFTIYRLPCLQLKPYILLVSNNYEITLVLLRVGMMWWADTEGFRKGEENVKWFGCNRSIMVMVAITIMCLREGRRGQWGYIHSADRSADL